MNNLMIREALEALLIGEASLGDTVLNDTCSILSYREADLLTYDEGLVVRMLDGTEFQITIQQSR